MFLYNGFFFVVVTYNIPVKLWLPDFFPIKAPLVFVVPTESMQIVSNANVDTDGKVKIDYLAYWSHVSPNISFPNGNFLEIDCFNLLLEG